MLAEGIPGGFSSLYDSLSALETIGVARRGYFVEGLGGAQFALPGAVERLRAQRDDDAAPPLVLAATDPAQPYGAVLKWPDSPRRPARQAGAYVVSAGAEPVLFVERGGKGLQVLVAADDPRIDPSLAALAETVQRGRIKRLALEQIDGEPVVGSAYEERLIELGFRAGPRKLTLTTERSARECRDTGCPRATRSTTRRTGSGRSSRATSRTRSRRRTRASAATAGPSASRAAPCRRRRPRQAPVPALRGRPDDPLAPAHDRHLARPRRRLAARRATPGCVIRRGEQLVAQFNGPVLELMTDSRTRFDRRIAGLGPDILAPELDEAAFLRRLREDDPTRPIGDALLDQRIIAGIGNLWKAEGCFEAGIDPWRRTGEVSDEEVLAIVHATRPRMQQSARDGMQERFKVVYGTAGPALPALRQGPKIRSAARATTTARHTGAHDASAEADRPQGRRPDRPRQHARVVRRRAGPRRRHDRVRRAARAPAHAGDGRLLLAHDYEHADGAPTLEEGLAHLASSPFDGIELDVDLKLPGYEERVVAALREHGLVERTLVSTNWMRSLVEIRASWSRAAPGLVGPAPEERPDAVLVTKLPAYAGAAYVRAKLPDRGQGAHRRGPLRRADGPLAARLTAPGARHQASGRRALRVDGRRRRRASAGSRSSASPGSSPTTRGSSVSCRARRSRRSSPPGRRPRWSGGRPRWRPRPARQRVPLAPAELDDAAQLPASALART